MLGSPRHRLRRGFLLPACALACALWAAPTAEATFRGGNGVIAVAREARDLAVTIWTIDPRTGRTKQLTHVPRRCRGRRRTWGDTEPSYSASGRLLTYVHEDFCDPRTKDGIYVMRADGRRRRLIREMTASGDDLPEYPAFSPSGEFVAFDQFLGSTYVMRAERRARERDLSECPGRRCPLGHYSEQVQPAWSPNGRRLALTLGGSDGEGVAGHIGTVDTRGIRLHLVTRSRRDAMPDWSPTGDRIAFQRQKENRGVRWTSNIFTAPAHPKRQRAPRRLTATGDAWYPVWSPNRRSIAFVRAGEPYPFGVSKLDVGWLWMMRARDGQAQRPLLSRVVADRISWQPRPRTPARSSARVMYPSRRL